VLVLVSVSGCQYTSSYSSEVLLFVLREHLGGRIAGMGGFSIICIAICLQIV
jgi:hypothetical protein